MVTTQLSFAYEIKSTTDYALFKNIEGNRQINSRHFLRLEKSILKNNRLKYHPIIVNPDLSVVDGQHRLRVAEKNHLIIYYIVTDKPSDLTDIIQDNTNIRKWVSLDFIDSNRKLGKSAYISLYTLLNNNKHLTLTSVTTLTEIFIDKKFNTNGEFLEYLSEGHLEITEKEFSDICFMILFLEKIYDCFINKTQNKFIFSRGFIIALNQVMQHKNFNKDIFINNLKKNITKLIKCGSRQQYRDLLTQIYNYRLKEGNRI